MNSSKYRSGANRSNSGSKRVFWACVLVLVIGFLTAGCIFLAKRSSNKTEGEDGRSIDDFIADAKDINTADSELKKESERPEREEGVEDFGSDAKNAAVASYNEQENPTTERDETTGLKKAEVYVTFAEEYEGNIEASGVISNIVSKIGNCYYTFSNGSTSFTETTGVLVNAKETSCESVSLDKERFSPGQWSVKIQYKSELSEGVSDASTFMVE